MAKTSENDNEKHEGDVLGISDANPDVKLPVTGSRGGRRPQGIEVGAPATGIGDVRQGTGVTGVDLGGSEGVDMGPDVPDVEEKPDSPTD